MLKIQENLSLSLRRVNFIFQNEEMLTECIKSHENLSLFGESFGPFEKGNNYKLKYFVALPLIQSNILKPASSEKCDNIDIQRYAISERDDQKLIRQDFKYFLQKIKEYKKFLAEEVNTNQKPKIDLDRYNSYTTNIIDSRLLKLLKISKANLSLDDEQRFTYSENILYKKLNSIIKAWRDFFLSEVIKF